MSTSASRAGRISTRASSGCSWTSAPTSSVTTGIGIIRDAGFTGRMTYQEFKNGLKIEAERDPEARRKENRLNRFLSGVNCYAITFTAQIAQCDSYYHLTYTKRTPTLGTPITETSLLVLHGQIGTPTGANKIEFLVERT